MANNKNCWSCFRLYYTPFFLHNPQVSPSDFAGAEMLVNYFQLVLAHVDRNRRKVLPCHESVVTLIPYLWPLASLPLAWEEWLALLPPQLTFLPLQV